RHAADEVAVGGAVGGVDGEVAHRQRRGGQGGHAVGVERPAAQAGVGRPLLHDEGHLPRRHRRARRVGGDVGGEGHRLAVDRGTLRGAQRRGGAGRAHVLGQGRAGGLEVTGGGRDVNRGDRVAGRRQLGAGRGGVGRRAGQPGGGQGDVAQERATVHEVHRPD